MGGELLAGPIRANRGLPAAVGDRSVQLPLSILHGAPGCGKAPPRGNALRGGVCGNRGGGRGLRCEKDSSHRRGLLDICRGLRALPGLEELFLTTNGSLLPNLAGPLRKAGVDRLNISLDTLRPDRFAAMTRLGRLEDALSGIQAAEDAGFTNLKLDTVLIGGFNDDEINDFLALTMDHPWEVRFIELMPMGPCAQWEKSCFLPVEHILKNNPALQILSTEGVARRYRLPQALGTVGLISPVSHDFCGACRRIRVTADGRLKGCLHSREERPLRGLHGEALQSAIRTGIVQKPSRHHLADRPSDTPRTMNQIGG